MADSPTPSPPPFELQRHAAGPLADLDPRAKLLAAFSYTLLLALAPGLKLPALGLAMGLVTAARSGLGLGLWLRRILVINSFVAFMWLFLPWRLGWDGEAGLVISQNPGWLALALAITCKVNGVFLVFHSLMATSRINDILHALAHWRLPHKLVALFLLFHRYLYVIHHEYQRLTQAMKVRGFQPGSNLHTYRSYANLVGVLLVRSYERAERVYQAMLCRGFKGTFWLLDHFHWRPKDTRFMLCWALSLAGMILISLV
jgi:cobalt/nickel transport system permease protein